MNAFLKLFTSTPEQKEQSHQKKLQKAKILLEEVKDRMANYQNTCCINGKGQLYVFQGIQIGLTKNPYAVYGSYVTATIEKGTIYYWEVDPNTFDFEAQVRIDRDRWLKMKRHMDHFGLEIREKYKKDNGK